MSVYERYYINGKEIAQDEAERHLSKYQQSALFKDIANGWSGEEEFKTPIGIITVRVPKL